MADEIKATGRRKTSIAVVKLVKGSGRIFVNGKKLTDYIGNRPAIEMLVYRPLVLTETHRLTVYKPGLLQWDLDFHAQYFQLALFPSFRHH